ncbi:hypothetical protein [Saccharomonospora cyanea]|uniref:Uncharacterized protein n=1 Tax=Saccharomonospora cyanea NA-134 TaxID=882082 RepID=H5XFM1_9PSEU|nr:hypothetical protein [Saccharomonospora cyanea]EHR59389.1 hypothetical protein SaccyDRAFT_0461 [Saccharomonospora cyanea NA-134]
MGDVVEQRGDATPGRPDDEIEIVPDDPGTDLTPAAPELDPEQLRQFREFQQFQQFQQFMRHQQAAGHQAQPGQLSTTTGTDVVAPPPPAPRTRRVPGWLQWLGRKILGWVVFFLLLAIFATWAFNELFGSDDDNNSTEAAARMGGGTYHTEELLAKEPHEAVRKVYDAIAQEDPSTNRPLIAEACGHFDNDRGIQQRFAVNTGHPDCRAAVLALHEQVTHVNDYAESIFPRWYEPGATTVRIDSCDFAVKGGPALGVFEVTEVEMGQWLITGHEPGPTTCPATGTTTATRGN